MAAQPVYTVLSANALTNVVQAEIPCTGLHCSKAINAPGTCEFTVDLEDSSAAGLVSNGAVEPLATSIYVLRSGTPIWGGILWKHTYAGNAHDSPSNLAITANEFGSYLAVRYVTASEVDSGDIVTVAQNWITSRFADGGPPLLLGTITASGITDTQTFNSWEQHKVSDLVNAYVTKLNGFDYSFDVATDGSGNNCARLNIFWPRQGVSYTTSQIEFDAPGQVLSYTLAKDGTQWTNDLIVTGAGSGSSMLVAEQQAGANGLIKVQSTVNNSDLTSQDMVTTYAQGYQTRSYAGGAAPIILTAVISGPDWFAAGLGIGDELTIAFMDPYHGSGMVDTAQRVTALDILPPTDSAPETVNVTFGLPL